jgi:cytidylate kinase
MKKIITISREFGSGGRTVGRLVAEKLGYTFYDNELITHVAKESGLAPEVVAKNEEYATHRSSLLYALATHGGAEWGGISFANQVQIAQAKVITALAEKGNCVIVGRGADYILRQREDVLHVFIHADTAFRAKHIVENYGETSQKPEERLRDMDKKRMVYYRSFSLREWGDYRNYHIALDTGTLGIQRCAEIVAWAAR